MSLDREIFSSEYQDLESIANGNKEIYKSNFPYPHICFDNFFSESLLNEILEEFPDLSTKNTTAHNNPREKKYGSMGEKYFGPKTKYFLNFLNSEIFLNFLQKLTDVNEPLIPDPYYKGGGQHEIKKGGLLKIHADFNKHQFLKLDRRLNVLIYLNKDWHDSYGGAFELWNNTMDKCVKQYPPIFNRMVIFSTTDFSYHGHPDSLNCPKDRSRKSLALFYYSNGRPSIEINHSLEDHSSLFQKRKGNTTDSKAFSLSNPERMKEVLAEFIPPILIKLKSKMFK